MRHAMAARHTDRRLQRRTCSLVCTRYQDKCGWLVVHASSETLSLASESMLCGIPAPASKMRSIICIILLHLS